MASPHRTTGSLYPAFAPDRLVCLTVKRPYAIALYARLPFVLRGHLGKPPLRFWRRPPQSNYPPNGVPFSGLELKYTKGSISTSTPRILAYPTHCLLPILHIMHPNSALSCSKGSRGLFVPLRVPGIFTGTTISPSSRLRQCAQIVTPCAGRNLPDKEFRYLRTVIVTAAVYRGLDSKLRLR